MTSRTFCGCFGILFAVLLFSACRSLPNRESLEKRVQRYWKYRISGDWGNIYEMLSMEERKVIARDRFLQDKKGIFKSSSFKIQSLKVEGNQGDVVVEHSWQIELPIPGTDRIKSGNTVLSETWFFENGDWFINLNRSSGTAPAK
jgi:hypothetical protein